MDAQTERHHHRAEEETTFLQTNLVSDGFVVPAVTIDPNLINPWGLTHSATSPFWVSDNGAGVTTVYNGDGTLVKVGGFPAITIAAPPGQTSPSSPTGDVFNIAGTGFNVTSGGHTGSSVFIFATEDGTISGWSPTVDPASSVLAVDNSQGGTGAVYKGLTIAQTDDGTFLYAANFRNGTVDVFDQNFNQVNSFTDPNVPAGYAPFNVQVLDNHLFVTFALQDPTKHDDVPGVGHGFVDEFDLQGHMLDRVASGGVLDSPWGLAIAPAGFGEFANDLLVGNFGDGTINVFNPKNDHFLGKLEDANGAPITIFDLWSLVPGSGNAGTDPNKIYFTAGVKNEAHGLFGSLAAIPESNNSAMSMTGSNSMTGSMTGSGAMTGAMTTPGTGSMTGSMVGSMTDTLTNPMAGSMTGSHSMHG
ncbi:TIGR03118 family protein [Bradyrhizobium erythrophlei]|uniref:TIGR03118 family protein n=2 Tax=Bradyrhizobium erythrophlei TaxID=1437360 RepID=A0A1M5JZ81_9BRAD|nr:TIGR03118 family protein [Bradyrhizobium erythrophlei]